MTEMLNVSIARWLKRHKEVTKLHQMLIKEEIIPKISLCFDMSVNSSFGSDYDEITEININLAEIDKMEKETGEEFLHLKTYLHEAGHAFHYYEFATDYDLKHGYYEIVKEFIHENIKSEHKQKVYERMPMEKEANILAELMWEQLQEDLHLILED